MCLRIASGSRRSIDSSRMRRSEFRWLERLSRRRPRVQAPVAPANSCRLRHSGPGELLCCRKAKTSRLLTTGSVNTRAFVGTNPTDEPITSGLPVTRPQSRATKHGHSFQFRQAEIAALIGRKPRIFCSAVLSRVASDSVRRRSS
jgi:hypothetical protein